MTYDYRQKAHLLTLSAEHNGYYVCPHCFKNKLGIDEKTGKAKCWTGDCDQADIRIAIDKLEGKPDWKPQSKQKWTKVGSPIEILYPARDGSALAKVVRQDKVDQDGNPDKDFYQKVFENGSWVNPTTALALKKQIPVYRYRDVQEAITQGHQVFVVEGEKAADALWSIGIPAATTIGGSGSYKSYGDYSQDLAGARLILCPDRDEPGLKYIANFARDFNGQIEGYCLAGEVEGWFKPSDGRDLADDVLDRHLGKTEILASVITVQKFNDIALTTSPSSVTETKKELKEEENTTLLLDRVKEAVVNLHGAGLTGELAAISQSFIMPLASITKMAEQLLAEMEAQEVPEGTRTEIEELQSSKCNELNIYDVLPSVLAEPIDRVARDIGQDTAAYIGSFLFGAGGVAHMATMVKIAEGFEVPPTTYGAMIAPPGYMKSNIYKKMVEKALNRIQAAKSAKYKEDLAAYKSALRKWEQDSKDPNKKGEDLGDEPREPQQIVIFATGSTIEGLMKAACTYSGSSAMYLNDELNAVLKGLNSYKGGGSDVESLLAHYDPSPIRQVRASGVMLSEQDVRFAVFGCLTPKCLDSLVQDSSDSNGQAGRFLLWPVTYTPQLLKQGSIDITTLLADIYEKIHNFPPSQLVFSQSAFDYYNPIQHGWKKKALEMTNKNGWASNIYSKACGQLGRVAGALHLIDCAINGELLPVVPIGTVQRAKKIMDFCTGFALSLAAEKNGDLAPHLLKLIDLAKSKGVDGLSVADAQMSLRTTQNRKTFKPSADTVIGYFRQLDSMGMGKIEKTARSFKLFSLESCPSCPSYPETQSGQGIGTRQDVAEHCPSCPSWDNQDNELGDQLGQLGQDQGKTLPSWNQDTERDRPQLGQLGQDFLGNIKKPDLSIVVLDDEFN